MKERKIEVVLLVICALFICFTLGFFIGRNTGGHEITVLTERQTDSAPQQTAENETASTDLPAVTAEQEMAAESPEPAVLNLNAATAEELTTLPGIGPVLAQRIVDFRTENGPFESVEQLTDVEGVGEKKLDAIREYLRIEE